MTATELAVELARREGHWRALWMGTAAYWLSVATTRADALAELENELRDSYVDQPGGAEVDWARVAAVLMDDASQ